MTMTLTAELPSPTPEDLEFQHRIRVALKNAGFMQVVRHPTYGSVECAGYELGPRGRLEYTEHVPDRALRATQQQRMKIMYTMCTVYAAVLDAAGFKITEKVTGLTNRPYLTVER